MFTLRSRGGLSAFDECLTVGKSRHERLRFLTLTSSPKSQGRDMNADFRALKMRSFQKFHFKMKYSKIRTNEGNGVLHIVYRGKYIPQKWLSDQWAEIHKSPIVDIRSVHETRKGLKGTVFYLVGNYLAKQSFEHMSWGYSWVFPAFVSCWKRLIEKYGFKQALCLWRRLHCGSFTVTRQVRLTRFLPEYEHPSEKSVPWSALFCTSVSARGSSESASRNSSI